MLEVIQTNAFADWFDGLKDVNAKGRIRARIARLQRGNFGAVKPSAKA